MIPFVFQNPMMLWLLLVVIPTVTVLRFARRRRRIVLDQMGSGELSTFAPWRDRFRVAAIVLLILALARPGFDPQRKSVSESGRDVVFVLDVSRSMLAEDASPNRLEAAKNGIRDALDSFSSERVGLVIYAGSSNILCPLTYDYNFVRYMLDQATTRAVDFGGTVLLSAIEKCVDNVLIEGREGMHDLVVLTDGEEHGAEDERVAELLKEHQAGLLLLGIGDSDAGVRIPILDEDGQRSYVKYQGDFVTTRLQDSNLRKLIAGIGEARYHSAGTSSFDLAGIYHDYVMGKPVSGAIGDDSFVVYREAAFLLIAVALLFLILGERRAIPSGVPSSAVRVSLLAFLWVSPSVGADSRLESLYAVATKHQAQGRFDEALEAFASIEEEAGGEGVSNRELAALRLNEGLCYLAQSKQLSDQEPRSALSFATEAQRRFLNARRLDPQLDRAAQRLDPTAQLILACRKQIAEEDEKNREIQAQMEALVERLQALHDRQTELRSQVPGRPRPAKQAPAPENATTESAGFVRNQEAIVKDAVGINELMKELDMKMSSMEAETGQPAPVTVLQEPLQLMAEAISAKKRAVDPLRQQASWPDARVQQQIALDKVQSIIDLLSSPSDSDESEEGDWEDEDWEDMEYSDAEDGMNSSIDGQGNMAAGAEMQALPTPNYSVQDILMQEQGSLQFRQEQRAAQNKGKVEKDW